MNTSAFCVFFLFLDNLILNPYFPSLGSPLPFLISPPPSFPFPLPLSRFTSSIVLPSSTSPSLSPIPSLIQRVFGRLLLLLRFLGGELCQDVLRVSVSGHVDLLLLLLHEARLISQLGAVIAHVGVLCHLEDSERETVRDRIRYVLFFYTRNYLFPRGGEHGEI